MERLLARIGLVVAIPILMAFVLLTPQVARGSRISPPPEPAQTAATSAQELFDTDLDEVKESKKDAVDLYGNEVTAAVEKYQFDATGSLYETHSPQTELPRLASPKS